MFQGFKNFFRQPFNDEMDTVDWFLFVGLLFVMAIIWRLILSHLLADA